MKRLLVIFLILGLLFGPAAACFSQEDDMKAEAMAADALIVRPISLVAGIIGGAIFIVSLPFSALGGNVEEASDYLVKEPFEFTFNRPLGHY